MAKKPNYEELEQRVKDLEKEVVELKQVEDELKESEHTYRYLAENVDIGITLIDPNHNIIWANRVVGEWFDKDPTEFAGEKCYKEFEKKEEPCSSCPGIEAMATGQPCEVETQGVRDDGTRFTVKNKAFPFYNIDGELIGFHEIVEDISVRKAAEKALQESEGSLAIAQEVADIGSWDWKIEDDTLAWSDKTYQQFGLKPGEITPTYEAFEGFVHPDDLELINQRVEQALNEDNAYSVDVRMIRKDGTEWIMHAQGEVYRDKDGKAIRFIGTQQDITERKKLEEALSKHRDHLENLVEERTMELSKSNEQLNEEIEEREQAEEALRESEEWFRHLSEAAFEGIAIHEEGVLLKANDQFFEIFGYGPKELLGKQAIPISIAPESIEFVKKQISSGSTRSYEVMGVKKDGTKFPMEIYAKPIEYQGRMVRVAAFRDITDRKRAEGALRESEEKYRTILESIEEAYFEVDIRGNFTFFNDSLSMILGYTKDELMGMNNRDYMTQESSKKMYELFNQIYKTGKPIKKVDYEIIRKDGSHGFHELSASLMRDRAAQPMGSRGVAHDITERKLVEKALRESEERFRLTVEATRDGLWENSPDHKKDFFSDRFFTMLGYEPMDPAKGFDFFKSLMHPDDSYEKEYNALNEPGHDEYSVEFRLKAKDGTWRHILSRGKCVKRDDEGKPMRIIGTHTDITELKQAQGALTAAQRMEALGTLAGGMAHNFNNLLMGIMGNTSLMLLNVDSTHPDYERLKIIEKSVQNGSRLTRQLLGYAREGRYEIKPISLNQLVKDTSDTFATTKKEIRVHQEPDKDLRGIKADQGQIEQALLNLYVNAADAMPGGGELFLKTTNVTHKDMTGKAYEVKPRDYVLVTVRDTGVGMDKKTKERIFDPFFTTKGLARGTGLGLASVYGTVKGHGGYIDVESKRGHGTTFSIYLPASHEKKVIKEEELPKKILKGKEAILLVDDEDIVLDVGEQMLKALGYKALIASGGKEAIELYKENKDKIGMVLLDMVMPDMGGGETYDRMKEINPDIKVLLLSGYSIDGEATEILKRGCDGFIQKPFDMKELSQRVREILDKG
jgi:PAS domain S-box-containing protein